MNTPVLVSATLAINEEMNRRRAAGLATVPLGFGEAGLPVLPELVDRLAAAAPSAGYGPVAGLPELRVAAAGYWTRRRLPTREEQVIAGPGSKPLLFALIKAVDGVVALPTPSWVSYAAQAAIAGRPAVRVPIVAGSGGAPDPELLDAAAARATEAGSPIRAVLMTLPDNPTGCVADPDLVAACCEVAERHDLLVISDEIYRDLVHEETPLVSPAELAPHRTVITTGLSKNLAVGGWRLGVLRLPDSELGQVLGAAMLGLASEIWSAPAQPVQRAAAWAFTEPDEVRTRIARSRRLHGAVAKAVSSVFTAAGSQHREPRAAFYLYPDFSAQREGLDRQWGIRTSDDLARILLDELGVATLPGTAFGDRPDALTLRVASSLLYGSNDDERSTALAHADPASLPWIAASLSVLTESLARLVG